MIKYSLNKNEHLKNTVKIEKIIKDLFFRLHENLFSIESVITHSHKPKIKFMVYTNNNNKSIFLAIQNYFFHSIKIKKL